MWRGAERGGCERGLVGIVVLASPPPRRDSAPGTTLPTCPAAPGEGGAGRLLRLKRRGSRGFTQVSMRAGGLGLMTQAPAESGRGRRQGSRLWGSPAAR